MRLGAQLLGQAQVAGRLLLHRRRRPTVARVRRRRPATRRRATTASRFVARTIRALVGLGPTHTSSRSVVSQGATAARSLPGRVDVALQPMGRLPQRQLAQGDQVALVEEILQRPLGLRRNVDLAGFEPFDQLLRREVDQLDLVGLLEHGVGQRLADDDAGDLGDHVVEALDVLDVERRPDVDAGVEQLVDVLPALGVPRALGVRVGQLVDEEQLRPPRQRRVEIELAQRHAAVGDVARRQRFEALRAAPRFPAGRAARRSRRRRRRPRRARAGRPRAWRTSCPTPAA